MEEALQGVLQQPVAYVDEPVAPSAMPTEAILVRRQMMKSCFVLSGALPVWSRID